MSGKSTSLAPVATPALPAAPGRIRLTLRGWADFWSEFSRDKIAVISLGVVVVIFFLAFAAPVLPLSDPMRLEHAQYQPPSLEHLMGTDNFGRSVLSRVIWGTQLGIAVGFISAGISIVLGVVLGAISGYFGGWVDDLLSRIFDIFLLIPSFFLALVMISLFGPNINFIILVIGLTMWPRTARIMRAQVLTLKNRTFVHASRVSGASHLQALFLHVIPNGLAPVVTQGTILVGSAILIESGLSYLGMGDPNTVSWGRMIFDGQQHLRIAPWISLFPGLAMLVLVTTLNLVGDGFNTAFNPKLRQRRIRRSLKAPAFLTRSKESVMVETPRVAAGETLLDVQDLTMYYAMEDVWVRSVDRVSLQLKRGESLGLVGESGCGKTSLGMTLMGVLASNARILDGRVLFDGSEILRPGADMIDKVRWVRLSMIFQSAMNALNPVIPVGKQLVQTYRLHRPAASPAEAEARVRELFEIVGIPPARMTSYAHELSGGMRQRVMICLALLLEPDVIIADEPTTALDVLVQDQILAELERLQKKMNLSIILISHDVGIIAEMCDRIAVMYAGQIVEEGAAEDIFYNSRHPYTRGLLGSLPTLTGPKHELVAIPGESAASVGDVQGCRFAARCPLATQLCRVEDPPMVETGSRHMSRCHYALDPRVETCWTEQEGVA